MPPRGVEVLAVLVSTQLPDLIDKLLAWGLQLFPSGYAIGHSVLVTLPLGLFLLWRARRTDTWHRAVAFVLGYWSHLLADVFDPLRYGRPPDPSRILWPVVEQSPYSTNLGLLRAWFYLSRYLERLLTGGVSGIDLVYLALPLVTVVIWLLDGAPGLDVLRESRG